MRYTSDEEGKIIDAKETQNYIIVTIQGKYDVKVKVIPKAKKKETKKPTTTYEDVIRRLVKEAGYESKAQLYGRKIIKVEPKDTKCGFRMDRDLNAR